MATPCVVFSSRWTASALLDRDIQDTTGAQPRWDAVWKDAVAAAARKSLDAVLASMHAAEYGKWKNWYRGDWLTGVYRTRELVQVYSDHLKNPMAKLPAPVSWSGWEAYFHIMQYEDDRSLDTHAR